MERKIRRELQIGWGIFVITLILKQFFQVPEMAMGMLMGLAISLMLVGSLSEKAYQGLKHWKKSFVK